MILNTDFNKPLVDPPVYKKFLKPNTDSNLQKEFYKKFCTVICGNLVFDETGFSPNDVFSWFQSKFSQQKNNLLEKVYKEVIGEDDVIEGRTGSGIPFSKGVCKSDYWFKDRNELREEQRLSLKEIGGKE